MPYLTLIGNRWKTGSVAANTLRGGDERSSPQWSKDLNEKGFSMEKLALCTPFVSHLLSQGWLPLQAIKGFNREALDGSGRFKQWRQGAWYDVSNVPTNTNLPHVFRRVWRDLREGLSEPIYPFTRWLIPPRNSSMEEIALTTTGGFGISKHHTLEWVHTLVWLAFPILMYRFHSKVVLSPQTPSLALQIVELTPTPITPTSITPLSDNAFITTLSHVSSWDDERRHVSFKALPLETTMALARSEEQEGPKDSRFETSFAKRLLLIHQRLKPALLRNVTVVLQSDQSAKVGLGWNRMHDRAQYYSQARLRSLSSRRAHFALGWDVSPSTALSAGNFSEISGASTIWLRWREKGLEGSQQIQQWLQRHVSGSGDERRQKAPFLSSATQQVAQSLLTSLTHCSDPWEFRKRHRWPEIGLNTLLVLPSRQPKWSLLTSFQHEINGQTLHPVANVPLTSTHLLPQVSQAHASQLILASNPKRPSKPWNTTRDTVRNTVKRVTPWDDAFLQARNAATFANIWSAVRFATDKAVKDEMSWSMVTIPTAHLSALPIAITSRMPQRIAKRVSRADHLATRQVVTMGVPFSAATVPGPSTQSPFRLLQGGRNPCAAAQATGTANPHKGQESTVSVASLWMKGTAEPNQPFSAVPFLAPSSESLHVPAGQAHDRKPLSLIAKKWFTLQPLTLPPSLTIGNWLTRYVALQVNPLLAQLDLMLTQPWWLLTSKRLKQTQSIVSHLHSHAMDEAVRHPRDTGDHSLGPFPKGVLRDGREFGMPRSYQPQPTMWIYSRLGHLVTLMRSAKIDWLSVLWVPCVTWLLLLTHGVSRLSGVAHLALWEDLERARSTKHPSMMFDMWLKAFTEISHSTQQRLKSSYSALFQWTHSLHDWLTPWWSEKPITDRFFLLQEKKAMNVFLGKKTISSYRWPVHDPQAQRAAKMARNTTVTQPSLVDGNARSYLNQWLNTISDRPSWNPLRTDVPNRLGWLNHRLSVAPRNALAKRYLPLEPSAMPARGFLLVGPVDTGKAYLAKRLAAEAEIPLVRMVLGITQATAEVREPDDRPLEPRWGQIQLALNRRGQMASNTSRGLNENDGIRQTLYWTKRIAASLDLARRLAPSLVWIPDLDMFCSKLDSDDLSLSLLVLLFKHLKNHYLTDLQRGIGLIASSVRPTALDPRWVSFEALTHVIYIRKPVCSERQSHLLGLLDRKQLVCKAIKPDELHSFGQTTVESNVGELVAISEEVHTIAIERRVQFIDAATLHLALSRRALEIHPVIESTTRTSCAGMLFYKVGRAIVQRMLAYSNATQPIFVDQAVWDTRFYYLTKTHFESSDWIASFTEIMVWPYVLSCLAGIAARDVLCSHALQHDNLALDRRASHDLGIASSLLQAFWVAFAGSDFCHQPLPQGTNGSLERQTNPRLARWKPKYLAPIGNDCHESESSWRQESLHSNQSIGTDLSLGQSKLEMRCSEAQWRFGLIRSAVFDWYQAADKPRFSSVVLPSYQGSVYAMPWDAPPQAIYYEKSHKDQRETRMLQANFQQRLKQQRMKLMGLPSTSQYLMEHEISQNGHVWLGEKRIWNPFLLERLNSRGVLVRDLLVTPQMLKTLVSVYGAKRPLQLTKRVHLFPVEPKNETLQTGPGAVQRLAMKAQRLREMANQLQFVYFLDLVEEMSLLSSPPVLPLEALEGGVNLDRSLMSQGPHDLIGRFESLRDRAERNLHMRPSNDAFVFHTLLEGYFYLFHFFRSQRWLLMETVQRLARKGILP